jgi:hypothetical protein
MEQYVAENIEPGASYILAAETNRSSPTVVGKNLRRKQPWQGKIATGNNCGGEQM